MTSRRSSRGSYRALQGAGQVAVDAALDAARGPHGCPRCGHVWVGPTTPPNSANRRLPTRTDEQRATRAGQLEATAAKLAHELRDAVTDSTFWLWLAPLSVVDYTSTTLYVAAPAEVCTWVRQRFTTVLAQTVAALAGRELLVDVDLFTVDAISLGELSRLGAPEPARREGSDAPAPTVDDKETP